jgi:hypothetical protein
MTMPTTMAARLSWAGGRRAFRPVALVSLLTMAITATVVAAIGDDSATAQTNPVSADVRTERLTLVGTDGATRAVLGEIAVEDLGVDATGLIVYDQDGRTARVGLGVTDQGQAGIRVHDHTGATRLQLFTGLDGRDEGSATIMGLDPWGTPRFELFFAPTPNGAGTAQIRVYDAAGNVRGNMAVWPDGGAVFDLLSGDPHRLRARLGIPPSGEPELIFFDEAGAVRRTP